MTGLGLFSLGLSPFGLGTPEGTQAPPDTKPTGSRFINFRTKDYEVASNGEIRRMPNVRHRVLMVLSTTLGSATTLPGLGIQFPERLDRRYAQLAEQRIRAALRPMVAAGELRIDFIRIERDKLNSGRVDHVVAFTDLTTGNSETVSI